MYYVTETLLSYYHN